jgi:hypothetical protein
MVYNTQNPPISKTKKSKELIKGVPVDARTSIGIAQMGLGFMPYGDVAGAGLEMVGTSVDIENELEQTSSVMGEDWRRLKSDSKAFKRHAEKLNDAYTDNFVNFAVASSGAIAGPVLVGMFFGPPGIIGGLLAGLGGTMAASTIKENVMPSQREEFLRFATTLQDKTQARALEPEDVFVALIMNTDNKNDITKVIRYLHSQDPNINNMNDMVRALDTAEGRALINDAMQRFDGEARDSIGALEIIPGENLSERLAMEANLGKFAGIDLLSDYKMGNIGLMLNAANFQEMEARDKFIANQDLMVENPNHRLPHRPGGKDKGPI